MTRKDYRLIASYLNSTVLHQESIERSIEWTAGFNECLGALCAALRHDSIRFDSVKFIDAIVGGDD